MNAVSGGAEIGRLNEVLAYDAPFLIEKLLKNRIVESPEEGKLLFDEVKKYLIMARPDEPVRWQMYSLRVDEVWHQFILFTNEYFDFCEQFFGRYVGHSPSNAPGLERPDRGTEISSFQGFQNRYQELFGSSLPDAWYDEKSITTRRRVFNDSAGTWRLSSDGEMVDLLDPDGVVLLSVNEIAREALAFVAETDAFYVRELPGDLTDDEKIALIATFVEYHLLRVGF